jgi:tRNA-(ms[2]io[6]A)-hydroxylase
VIQGRIDACQGVPMSVEPAIEAVLSFVGTRTPERWLQAALCHRDIVLLDHANCEKKAAATAVNLMFRYPDRADLLDRMSRLAREELLHFEQVREHMDELGVTWRPLSASRYASRLRSDVATSEPARLSDTLIAGAFIEARSCERFIGLAERVEGQQGWGSMARYYRFLLASESRHFQDYLTLARDAFPGSDEQFDARVAHFRVLEQTLIDSEDPEFRFHSGVPATDR